MPIAVYFACRWNSSSHLLAHQWLSSFVCRFLIELCGLCLKLSKLYNVLDVDKSIIYVGDFTSGILVGIICHTFGQFTWKIGSLSLDKLLIVVLWLEYIWTYNEQAPLQRMEFAYGTEINFQCDNLWFNSWNLDTSNSHLALDKSILTIANYSWNWKLDPKLGSLIEQNLSGRLQALVFILSEDYRKEHWRLMATDIGHLNFGTLDVHLVM